MEKHWLPLSRATANRAEGTYGLRTAHYVPGFGRNLSRASPPHPRQQWELGRLSWSTFSRWRLRGASDLSQGGFSALGGGLGWSQAFPHRAPFAQHRGPCLSALTIGWGPLPPQHRPGTRASAQEMLAEDKASHSGKEIHCYKRELLSLSALTWYLCHSNYLCSEEGGTWPTQILQIKWLRERGLSSSQTQGTRPFWLGSPHLITCPASSVSAPGGSPLKRRLVPAKEKAAGL